MSQFLNSKMILVLAISALMLAGCGRKNALQPVGPNATSEPETGEIIVPEQAEKEDKPFILDALL